MCAAWKYECNFAHAHMKNHAACGLHPAACAAEYDADCALRQVLYAALKQRR